MKGTANSGPFPVLVIDENPRNEETVRSALQNTGVRIITSNTTEDGLATFRMLRPRIVLLSLPLAGKNGMEVLQKLLGIDPGIDVILLAEKYSVDSASSAINKGAADFMAQPLEPDRIRARILELLGHAEQRRKTMSLEKELLGVCQFEGIIGRSPLMLEIFAQIRRIATHFQTVLVTGPTGTGKEMVAQALHRRSPVSSRKFVVCNCSALVESLAESELFGHVRGAFTGADQDKTGLFEHADGGTIFLDEVGELSPPVQAKLLRVLQHRYIQRVGSLDPRDIDVRVIAATHRDLRAMVRRGEFREDLYYRLAVIDIRVPSLASRREDLPLLMRHFVQRFAAEYSKPIIGLTRRAQQRLSAYAWPGNVRELENVIGNACMMMDGNLIDISDLPEKFRSEVPGEDSESGGLLPLEEVQRRHVLRVLEGMGGNKARAAEVLGIGRATVYQFLNRVKEKKTTHEESGPLADTDRRKLN